MRISGGKFRGRKLAPIHGKGIRPSAEKVRQAMFDALASRRQNENLAGLRVLDVFAGSGILGFEALSRGASFALFLDKDKNALATIRHNADEIELDKELDKSFDLRRRDVTRLGKIPGNVDPFDLVFCDPPYSKGLGEHALTKLESGGWLSTSATIVVEEAASATLTPPPSLEPFLQRRYGDTQLFWLILNPCA